MREAGSLANPGTRTCSEFVCTESNPWTRTWLARALNMTSRLQRMAEKEIAVMKQEKESEEARKAREASER